jgi:hypothetical protein
VSRATGANCDCKSIGRADGYLGDYRAATAATCATIAANRPRASAATTTSDNQHIQHVLRHLFNAV